MGVVPQGVGVAWVEVFFEITRSLMTCDQLPLCNYQMLHCGHLVTAFQKSTYTTFVAQKVFKSEV